jgi:lysophospholipase
LLTSLNVSSPATLAMNVTDKPGLTGSVSPVYAPGMSLSRAGVVAGLDMTTEAALTKMSYLLALPDSTPESVAKAMSVSLRGELTEVSQPMFRHPDGALPERVQTLTTLGYAIAQGDLERVQEIFKIEHHWILNDADYSGNTPIVWNSFFSDSGIYELT